MSILENIDQNISKAETLQKSAFQKIADAQDQSEQKINTTELVSENGESINTIKARLVAALALFRGLLEADHNYTLVPYSYLDGLDNSLINIATEIEKIIAGFAQLDANGGIASITQANLVITSQNGQYNFELKSILSVLDKHIDAALDSYYRINIITGRADYTKISSVVDALAEVFNELSNRKNELSDIMKAAIFAQKKAEKAGVDATTQLETAENTTKKITQAQKDADDVLKKINETQGILNQQSPVIDSVYQKATTLKKDIDNYQADFTKFQSELDARVTKYTDGNNKLEALLKSLEDQENEIKRINAEASAALNFSTVAGLAKGFGDKKDHLATEQENSYKSFKNSLWLFFFSSLIPLGYLVYKVVQQGKIELEELSMALLPVIPAVVFTKFAASKHNNLFKLREHYAHKYSVSFSLKGFKDEIKQEHQKDIVEATFKDLAIHNPANTIDNRDGGDRHPLPFWDSIASFFAPRK